MFDLFAVPKMLLAVSPFLLLCLLGTKVNLKKELRVRQMLMPLFAVIFCAAAFLFVDGIHRLLMRVIDAVPAWAALVWPQAGAMLSRFLGGIDWTYWIFYISNSAILLAYYAVKRVVISVFAARFKNNDGAYYTLAGLFYDYHREKDLWAVKEPLGQTRVYFNVFFYSAVVLSSALFLLCKIFTEAELIAAPFFPVFGILIVSEICFFLNGLTYSEYQNELLGEEEYARKVVDYSLMRQFLRALFGDRLGAENTVNNHHYDGSDATNDAVIEELLLDGEEHIGAFGKFIEGASKKGLQLDHNFLRSAVDLLKGKSVIFNNPFYKDLIPYAFYPMNRTLMRHKKVMVILGRHSVEQDIEAWLREGITAITNVPPLWNIGVLSEQPQSLDVGIVTRSDTHNLKLHEANRVFFSQVEFVVIIEPSKLISTAQVGLKSLIMYCQAEKKNIVYCSCDKNCDGLVDALSHILMTNICEVSATDRGMGKSSYMCWDYEEAYTQHRMFPNISRYLGIGTELSAAALKNQIQNAAWYGGSAYPVTDQLWIMRQYYYDILRYCGLAPKQETLMDRIQCSANLWAAAIKPYAYLTVEDEANNLFETVRAFSTRASEEGFVNVISGEYLLKEYMADNARVFMADPKTIPCIVADYARTDRNLVSRVLITLSVVPLTEAEIQRELSLLGIRTDDVKKSLWAEILKCYSPVTRKYDADILSETLWIENSFTRETAEFRAEVIAQTTRYSVHSGEYENVYTINDTEFISRVINEFQSADYIAEDEKGETHYLGAELRGHIFQRHLPGQFFTFDGKYYEMCALSADYRVVVRRAADHITGRPHYRQMREYTVSNAAASAAAGARKTVSGILISNENADIRVETPAYLDMPTAKDYSRAKKIVLHNIPVRNYKNKTILRIVLPNAAEHVRYSVAYLLNEVFRTVFAENQAFISAVTSIPAAYENNGNFAANPLTYSLRQDGKGADADSIYILEDSLLDLGLLVAVERNFNRLLEIIYDFLEWHLQAVEDSKNPPPAPEPIPLPAKPVTTDEKAAGVFGIFRAIPKKIKEFFKKIFKRSKKGTEVPETAEEIPETAAEIPETAAEIPETTEDTLANANDEAAQAPDTPDGTLDFVTEDEVSETPSAPAFERAKYHLRHYFLFGGSDEASAIAPSDVMEYLAGLGFDGGALKQARHGKAVAEAIEKTYHPRKPGARFCDFCGTELTGTEYEVLSDGRERCMRCGKTAIKTGKEFIKIFTEVLKNMEAFYGVKFNAGIRVEMVNSKKLHRRLKKSFVPSGKMDARVLGVAIRDSAGYTILIENGSPRMASIMTIAHELTHIWQYLNWDGKAIQAAYGKEQELEVYEGMAKWVEIQYALLINEPAAAKLQEMETLARTDEYGRGFIRYFNKYPFSAGTSITRATPFMNKEKPL
ncbi:MAG: hypothetical protein LBH54_00785 [Clostridiales bacterium]|jgi:hypothetical protein|nr:hypothetical protein [Clostridiales bacterium]